MIEQLKQAGIGVSLFIDPEPHQIEAAAALGADFVEFHTGAYANLADKDLAERYLTGVDSPRALKAAKIKPGEATAAELRKIRDAVKAARALRTQTQRRPRTQLRQCRSDRRDRGNPVAAYRPCDRRAGDCRDEPRGERDARAGRHWTRRQCRAPRTGSVRAARR